MNLHVFLRMGICLQTFASDIIVRKTTPFLNVDADLPYRNALAKDSNY